MTNSGDQNERVSKVEYMLNMAQMVATRSTCRAAKVGCVITNSAFQILSTGYNGMMPGAPECDGVNCKIQRHSQSQGTVQTMCPTIHAEANALHQYQTLHKQTQLPPRSLVFVTLGPCLYCANLLQLAGAKRVYYIESNSWVESYRHRSDLFQLDLIHSPLI